MPGRYAATGAQDVTTATPGDSALAIESGTDQRPQIFDWTSGWGGTPADNAIALRVQRTTTAGTGGAVVAEALDPDDPASRATVIENLTVEGTAGGIPIFEQIINQRATYRWVAAPGGEIVLPALASNGLSFASFHASYALSHEITVYFVD